MTDYTRGTGSSGTMMIRDNGLTISFWINSNNGSTWTDHLPWSGTVNGTGVGGTHYYHPGSGWNQLGSWNVWGSGNVTFNIGNSGTSGFGGPTSFTVFINRSSRPNSPSTPTFSNIGSTTIDVAFTDGANNGAAIDQRLLAYGTSTDLGAAAQTASDGTTSVSGLTTGVTYYFWAATHNSQGWSDWSPRSQATMLRVPDAPSAVVISDLTQKTLTASFTVNGNGGSAINSTEVWYSLTNTLPGTNSVSGASPRAITNLLPGRTYYFWSRAHNAVGWSGWSEVTVIKMIAGARVRSGGVWKDAVPYVRVSGVWKVARPWVKVAGVWEEAN